MSITRRRFIHVAMLTAPVFAAALPRAIGIQDHYAGRDAWQRVDDIFEAMGARTGSVVADFGAGGGFFTTRLAKAVGSTGRVLAVDVNPSAIRQLHQQVASAGLTNVTVIPSERQDPKLPANALDAILIVNAYHEMSEYKVLLPRLRTALKPAGRLVIVDNRPLEGDVAAAQQPRHPYLSIDVASAQLIDAGFTVTRRDDRFTSRIDERSGAGRIEWLLAAMPKAV